MTLRFERAAWSALCDAVRACYPHEACGVCLSRDVDPDVIVEVRALRNTAADPRRSFAFDDAEHLAIVRAVEAREERVRAFYHSHPDGEASLSRDDLAAALVDQRPLWPGVDWIVAATRGVELHALRRFRFVDGEPREGPLEIAR